MSSSNAAPAPSSKILSSDGTYVSGIITDQALTKDFRITASGSRSLRADIYVGKVVATGSVTGKLAHSSGYNIWGNTNTVTITASTDKTVSAVDTSANTLTSTSHGFVEDQAVVIYSSGETPAPIKPNLIYYVQKVDANTIKLRESIGGPAINITAAGSGTITACAARCFSITMQETVSGDQSYTPLKALGRVVVTTTNSADRCQVADVVILLGE